MAQDEQQLSGTVFDRATRTMFTEVLAELALTLREDELSLAQVATLHLLFDDSLHVLELGERLGLSASGTSRMIDALAQRGLLSRVEDPSDRRARVLGLTAKGRALADRLNTDRLRVFARHIPAVPQAIADRVFKSLRSIRKKR